MNKWIYACLLLPAVALAQAPFESRVAEDPFNWARYIVEEDAGIEDSDAEVSITVLDINAALPAWQSGNSAVLIGAQYIRHSFDFSEPEAYEVHMLSLGLPVDVTTAAGENWILWGRVNPGIYGRESDLEADDARVTGFGVGVYRWNDRLQLAAGAAYDREFGDDQLYPLAGAIWDIYETLQLYAILPDIKLIFAPVSRFQLYAGVSPAGGMWKVRDHAAGEEYDIKLEGYRLGLGAEVEIIDHVWLNVGAGSSVERNVTWQPEGGRREEGELDEATYYSASVVIR